MFDAQAYGKIAGMRGTFRTYSILLALESCASIAAPFIFDKVHPKFVAALCAGSLFMAIGIAIFALGLRDKSFRKSATFVVGCVHLFLTSAPMLVVRALDSGRAFEDVRIWGIKGPAFHGLSEAVYLALLLATLFDWFRYRPRRQKQRRGESPKGA